MSKTDSAFYRMWDMLDALRLSGCENIRLEAGTGAMPELFICAERVLPVEKFRLIYPKQAATIPADAAPTELMRVDVREQIYAARSNGRTSMKTVSQRRQWFQQWAKKYPASCSADALEAADTDNEIGFIIFVVLMIGLIGYTIFKLNSH